MEKRSYESQRIDHLGIVSGICKEIGLIEIIDRSVLIDGNRRVSCGEATQAMVLNALGLTGRALYLMPEYLKNKPVDILIAEGLKAEDFNDDSLGRSLDELQQIGVTELYAYIASIAVKKYDIQREYVHLDTSSISVTGRYDSDYAKDMERRFETAKITHGYSKEHRPDLKQVVVSLITSQASSIPLWLEVLDGNSSDKHSFRETVSAYCKGLEEGESPPCFVMDSAGYSAKNITTWEGIPWLTRVPESINEVKALKRSIATDEMTDVEGTTYAIHPVSGTYADIEQRWLLVYSQQAYEREKASFLKRLQNQKEEAHKAFNKLKRTSFHCQDDAKSQAQALAKQYPFFSLNFDLLPLKKYHQPGRPAKDAVPCAIHWRVHTSLSHNQEYIDEHCAFLGRFVLASNTSVQDLSDQQLLDFYKQQASSVERGFRFLRDPLFFADSLFVKSPVRIMAMTFIMGLSLLIYSLAELILRRQLAECDEFLPSQTGKPSQAITMRRIAQIFEGVDILIIRSNGNIISRQILNLSPLRLKILRFFSTEVQFCYLL